MFQACQSSPSPSEMLTVMLWEEAFTEDRLEDQVLSVLHTWLAPLFIQQMVGVSPSSS